MVEERVARPEQGELFLPPGFRFHPTDEEVITSYLLHKMLNPSSFAPRAIGEVNLNKCEPWDLPSRAKMAGEKVDEWYFFCHKDMKYPTGMRTNRATKAGYWKATGKDREIFKDPASAAGSGGREVVGMKKTLVFYMGRAPRGSKTNWVMHEFRLDGKYRDSRTNQLRLISPKDEWVVCKVFHKNNGEEGNNKKAAAAVDSSVGTTPDVSSISVDDATGGDGDGFFLDSMIDDPSVYFFNSTATSLPDTTTTAMNNNAGHPPTGSYTLHDHQAKALGLAGDIISPDFGVVNLPSSSAASTAGISQQINSLRRRNYYGGSYATNYYLKSDAKNLGA